MIKSLVKIMTHLIRNTISIHLKKDLYLIQIGDLIQ